MESLGLTAVVREFDERVVAKKQQRKPTPEKSLGAHQRSVGLSAPTTRRSSRYAVSGFCMR